MPDQHPTGKTVSERNDRLHKLVSMRQAGIDPYPADTGRTHGTADVIADFAALSGKNTAVCVAGRLRSLRGHGNLVFAHIEDQSGLIQAAFSKKDLGPDPFAAFIDFADAGDFIEVSGAPFLTQKNEKTIMAASWRLLAKALRPLPDKRHGLKDDEKRQRFRELEMLGDRAVLEKFERRSRAIRALREFMWAKGFAEIETPILQNVYGGTYARPFMTRYNALDFDLYLRIAPEIFLKRAVVGGFEKIFEIGKCFRNEGMGPAHLQGFTMFEFYWPYADYEDLIALTEELLSHLVSAAYAGVAGRSDTIARLRPPFPRIGFRALIARELSVPFDSLLTREAVAAYVKERGLETLVDLSGAKSWAAAIDELYKKAVRKKIAGPVFITDYPKEFMALAKTKAGDAATVATFQLVIDGFELVKAYNELNDPIDQRERFEEQERLTLEGDEEAMPYDRDFVESMEHGMPPMAGWGMGLDRLFTLLEGEENIREVVVFPTMRPLVKIPNDKFQITNKIQNQNDETIVPAAETPDLGISYDQARELLIKYVSDERTRMHCRETEVIMRALAKRFGEDEEAWGIVGLLHDIDWDLTKADIKNHTVKAVSILKEAGGTDALVAAVVSHAYGNSACGEHPEKERTTRLEHALVASETATGLIIAAALMQPDKKLASVKLESLKKKFKQKAFAANCDRALIAEIEKAGLPLDDFLKLALESIQEIYEELGL